MNYKSLLIVCLSISISTIYAQTPETIRVQGDSEQENVCNGPQDAGTINTISPFPSNSGSIISFSDTTFLCYGDSALVEHNNDMVLDGDPNPATMPEVGYAFYSCPPTAIGDNLSAIQNDACVINDPPTTYGIYIARSVSPSDASLVLANDGGLNTLFNNGNPTLIYFAPITVDAYTGTLVYEDGGSCVNVSVDQSFPVVYLNELTVSSQTTAGLSGSFVANGGYPEFDGSANYTITSIIKTNDPGVTAPIPSGNFGHGDRVNFSVPEEGTYTITLEDRTNCSLSFEMTFTNDAVVFNIGELDVELGDNFCIPVTVTNFDSIEGVQFAFTFDPNVISYDSYSNWALSTDEIFSVVDVDSDKGVIKILWISSATGVGESLPDGSTIVEFCFTTAPNAQVGDMTILDIRRVGTFVVEVSHATKGGLDVGVDLGKVTIIANSLTANASSCGSLPGRTDGEITVNAFSGQAPYTVSISGPTTDNGTIASDGGSISFSNLPPGMYSITVTDDNGQTHTFNKEVYDGGASGQPRPNFDLIDYKPSCYESSDGRIELDTSSGHIVRPFSIEWSTNEYNTDMISGLERGTYFVTVTDAFGCEEVGNQTLSQTQISISANITDASCSGYSNGTADLTASGGTPMSGGQYVFTWDSGTTTGSGAFITDLQDGWHNVTVTDDNNCEIVDSFYVSASRKIVLNSLVVNDPLCNGENNGSITLEAGTEGGTANTPYTISIEVAGGSSVGTQTGADMASATGLPAGQYTITVEDNTTPDACVLDTTITLRDPEPISVDVTKTNITCNGNGMDGTITLDVSGGTPLPGGDYQYNWVSLANSNSHSNLATGTYFVTVEDANGCTNELSVTIDPSSPPQLVSVTNTLPTCPEDCDGTITITARPNPGFDIVRYRINRPGETIDTLTNSTEITIGGFCGGDFYSVTEIEDEAGCIIMPGTFDEFPERDPLSIDTPALVVEDPSCVGNADGRIILALEGAVTPYIVQWNGNAVDTISGTTDTLSGLSAGTYSVTVNDINNCGNLELDFTLSDPPLLSADFSNQSPASCFNDCDGSVTAAASGGSPAGGVYDFEWSSGFTENGVTTSTANDLCAGQQWVSIDDGSCLDTFYFNVDAPDSIVIDIVDLQSPSCFGLSDGGIEVQASGGNGSFNYNWEGGPGTAEYSGIPAGSYIIEVEDAQMCIARDTIDLDQPDSLNAFIPSGDIMHPSCPGMEDGMLTVTVNGGNGSNNYSWTNTSSTTEVASGLDAGTYVATVSDMNNCTDTAMATLVTADPIEVTLPIPDTPACEGGVIPYLIAVGDVSGGNGGPYQYRIGNSSLVAVGTEVSTQAGDVILSVVDNNGCTFDTLLSLPTRDGIELTLAEEIEIGLGDSASLMPDITSESPIVSYTWTPASGLSCTDCPNPIARPVRNTTYTFTVTDENGCTASIDITVNLNTRRKVYIPNVFTPNNDGINDIFSVYAGQGVREITSFQIFDRWGNVLWEGKNLPPSLSGLTGWDGSSNGEILNPGVYAYNAEVLFVDDRVLVYRGTVTLLSSK